MKTMGPTLALLLAWLTLPPAFAAAAAAYRFSRAIEYGGATADTLLAVTLDSPIYAATRDGYPDLRILDDSGAETPFLLEKSVEPSSETVRVSHPGSVSALQKRGQNGIEITLHTDKDAPATDGLTVVTPASDFEHRVQVQGSNDGKNWTPLVRDALLFDYSRHMDVSNRDIVLPKNNYRQFKLLIEDAEQTRAAVTELTRELRAGREQARSERSQVGTVALRIDRIEPWHNVSRELAAADKTVGYPIAAFETHDDPDSRSTVVDITTRREPLTRLSLQSATRNFNRPATVQIPVRHGIETRWRDIGSATLLALHYRDIDRAQSAIAFPEQRQEHYRVVIRNDDNPPLAITGVQAQGNRYRQVFVAAPGKAYRVLYGAEMAERPRYDETPIVEPLRAGYPAADARLGPEVTAAGRPAPAVDVVKLLNSKWFLGAVIALTVAVLAWALVGAGRRIGQLPDG